MSHLKRGKGGSTSYDPYNNDPYSNSSFAYSAYDSGQSYASGTQGNRSRRSEKKGPLIVTGVIVAILLIWLAVSLILGPTRGQCRELVSELQAGCNELSATKLIGTLKPSTANILNGTLILTGLTTNSNPDDWLPQIVNALGGDFSSLSDGTDMDTADIFRQIRLKVRHIGLPGTNRRIRCKATFGAITQYLDIYAGKSHGEPYIRKIRLVK